MIATRWHSLFTRSRLWLEKNTVLPFAQCSRMYAMISAVDWGSSPIIGSSSTHSFGSWMSAAMMQIFCFIPWE